MNGGGNVVLLASIHHKQQATAGLSLYGKGVNEIIDSASPEHLKITQERSSRGPVAITSRGCT